MIAVVTGGSGFIGRNLVERLVRDGHEVRCLARPRGGEPPAQATRYQVALDDSRALLRCPAFEDADVVFHLAGATRAARPRDFWAANVETTRSLLGALVARRLRPRFVLVSSQAAAGPARSASLPVREMDEPRPIEAYGGSKLEAERVAGTMANHVPVTVVRPCSVFGPRDADFLRLFRMAERGVLVYPGVADHWLSLVHVDDVVQALMAAANCDRAIGRTYFVAAEPAVSWRTLGGWIQDAVRRPVTHVNAPRSAVSVAGLAGEFIGRVTGRALLANRSRVALARAPYWVCSGSLARSELGLPPDRSLPEAVADTYLWYRQHGWVRSGRTPAIRA